jgi:hypothetical protein
MGFPHEIKEMLCKFLFIDTCRLYIFIVTFTLLVHMHVLHDALEEIAHVRP